LIPAAGLLSHFSGHLDLTELQEPNRLPSAAAACHGNFLWEFSGHFSGDFLGMFEKNGENSGCSGDFSVDFWDVL
jgi:hypothetical protein